MLSNQQGKTTASRRRNKMRLGIALCIAMMILPMLATSIIGNAAKHKANVQIRPTIPLANRNQEGRVFIEHADLLSKLENDSFLVLTGSVEFVKGGMHMFCDSAHFYEATESLDAFGNVRMEQGDTLFVYADELQYDGINEFAYLFADFGKKVRMINRNVQLRTDVFTYDLFSDIGFYENGGELSDDRNILTSIYGEYIPSTKEANFRDLVHLTSRPRKNPDDTLHIYTDTLYYNVNTHVAEIYARYENPQQIPARIVNKQGTIFTRLGNYNTQVDTAMLFDKSVVITKRGSWLTADTLFYDRTKGYGQGFGNMAVVDTVKSTTLMGDYGFYNELTDSAFVTGRALAMEYSKGDTLFLHGKRIYSFMRTDTIHADIADDDLENLPELKNENYQRIDTTHIIIATPRVRFYRTDVQGLCDSLRFEEADSTLRMFGHPIIWHEQQQIFGNTILLHFNDSTVDRATLPDFALTAQLVDEDFFNQLSGKKMTAYFENGEMRHLDVDGNVQMIMLPEENDSTYNKIINAESSFLSADFNKVNGKQELSKLKMWPETSGTVTPLYLAKKSLFRLPKFEWYDAIRPRDRHDIFIIPPEMDALMEGAPAGADSSVVPIAAPVATPESQSDAPGESESEPDSNPTIN